MYAVFEDGSRQYRVTQGDTVVVDYRDVEAGSRVEFDRVLLFVDGNDAKVGQPFVEGMRVVADVVRHPSKKYVIQHFHRRKNVRRLKGHRQWFTAVKVKHILLPGQQPPAEEAPPANTTTPPATEPAPAKPGS